MSYLKKAFGCNVRLIRKSRNLTQEQLAEMVNLNQRQLTRIENGVSFVSADVLENLAVALNTDIKKLFDFEDSPIFSSGYDSENVESNVEIYSVEKMKEMENLLDKIKKLAKNEKHFKYINLAFESLQSKEARQKLKNLIEGMELVEK